MRTLTLLAAVALAACGPAPEGPDLILTGGVVRLDGGDGTATAVAIDGDRIVAVGSDAEIQALAIDDTQEMALEGAAVLAGFVDHWVDLEALGRWQQGLDLGLAASPREVQARVREQAAAGDGWIVGHGWDETVWPDSHLPGREALDAVTTDRPVLLYRRSGDIGWVNSVALERAALGEQTPGLFLSGGGTPTGIVAGPALRRIEAAMPATPPRQRREWLEQGLQQVAAAGITTVETAPLGGEALEILRALQNSDGLPVRVAARVGPGIEARIGGRPSGDAGAGDARVVVLAVGLTVDGPFRPPLAALAAPYPAGGEGRLWVDASAIGDACDEAARRGLRLDVRVHGDRALAVALEACPALGQGDGMVIGGDLLPRPAEELPGLRLAAVPGRLTHDLYWLEEALGAERARQAHRYRDALAAGILAGLASEAPEHPLAPMAQARVLATRRDAEGYPLDGWLPGQRVAVADTLRVAAGPLRQGGVADIVVWSGDPLSGDEDLLRLQAMVTIVGGRVVYSRPLVNLPFELQ